MDIERKNYLNECSAEDLAKLEQYKTDFAAILKKRHGIEINDCTDEEQIKQAFLEGDTPTQLVEFLAGKYDLDRIDGNSFYS